MIDRLKRSASARAGKPGILIQLRESGAKENASAEDPNANDDRPVGPVMEDDPNAASEDEMPIGATPAEPQEGDMPSESEMTVDDNGNIVDPNDPSAIPPEEMPSDQPQELTGKFGNVKIYDLMMGLARYVDIYIDAYNDVETDQLSAIQLASVAKSYKDVLKLRDDLKFYMMSDFSSEQYKKNLYTYLLFNKRFSEIIGKFRHALRLNADDLAKGEAASNGKTKNSLIEPGK